MGGPEKRTFRFTRRNASFYFFGTLRFADYIHEFCTSNYDVHFPQFAKIDVNGSHEIALYSYLKREQGFRGFGIGTMAEAMDKMLKKQDALYASNSDIKWNFTKFLVSREGKVISRFEPTDDMDMVEKCIVEALHK